MIPPIEFEVVLIRHGITKWNMERRYLGHTDLPLLPSAIKQLAQLKEQPELSGEFWRVCCSDLLRCRETLSCIAPRPADGAVYDKRLREMNFGDWEGYTYEQLKDNELYRSWLDDPAAITPPNGESWGQFADRLSSFWTDLGQVAETFWANEGHGRDNSGVGAKLQLQPHPEPQLELERQLEPQSTPLLLRVLIMTHGGVIRQLLAKAMPDATFQNVVAPLPGTATRLKLAWFDGQWRVAHSELI